MFISVISDTGYIVAYNAITEFVTMHSEKQFGKTHCLNFVVQPRGGKTQRKGYNNLSDHFPINIM